MSKVNTFTETFTDLSAWTEIEVGLTGDAVAGQLVVSDPGGTNQYYIYTVTGYDFTDSWTSMKVVDLTGGSTGSAVGSYIGAVDAGFTETRFLTFSYVEDTDTCNLATDFGGGTLYSFANPGMPFHIGMNITSGTVLYGYSTDSGATWIQGGTATWSDPGGDPNPSVIIAVTTSGTVGSVDYLLDDINIATCLAADFGIPDPSASVDPGQIDISGVALDAVTLSAAKVETFTDTFSDFSNWTASDFFGMVSSAAGDAQFTSPMSTVATSFLDSNDEWNFHESWVSLKIADMYTGITGTATSTVGLFAFSGSDQIGVSVTFDAATNTVNFETTGGTSHPVASTGVPLHIGFFVHSSILYGSYKIDSAPWVLFDSAAWTDPNSDPYPTVQILAQVNNTPGSSTLILDDLNIETLSYMGPLNTDVDPFEIPFTGVPLTGVTLGTNYSTGIDPGSLGTYGQSLFVTLGPLAPSISIVPAQLTISMVDIDPIVGTYLPGDPFAAPIIIRESGSASYAMTGMTLQSGEPTTSHTKSLWIKYQADGPMTATFSATSADPFVMEIFNGDTLDNLEVANSGASFSQDVGTGYTYLRLTSSTTTSISLTWSYVVAPGSLLMDVLTPVREYTPDDVQVSVQGGAPGESIKFTWSPPVSALIPGSTPRPITLATVSTDFEGNILTATLPIPAAPAGSYTINAVGLSSGNLASGTFRLLQDSYPADTSGSDATPEVVVGTKWQFDEGTGTTWQMEVNPDRMSSIVFPKLYSAERTTAGAGQHIIWEGTVAAMDWGFSGVLFSEEEHDSLVSFFNLDRKFYVTTHKGDTLIVTFKTLDMTPKRNSFNFQTWEYSATLLLYGKV